MCEITKIKGKMPDGYSQAVKLIGDPIIEIQLVDGKPSDDDKDMIIRLKGGGHKFKVVTFDDCDRAFVVAEQ